MAAFRSAFSDESAAEAQEAAEALRRELSALSARPGREPDPEQVNRAFRRAHSFKALASLGEDPAWGELAHALEDSLDDLRFGRVALGKELAGLLQEAADALEGLAAPDPGDAAAALGDLVARLQSRPAPGGPREAAREAALKEAGIDRALLDVLTAHQEHRLAQAVKRGKALLRVRARWDWEAMEAGLADLHRRLQCAGEVIATLPASGGPGACFELLVALDREAPEAARLIEGLPAEVELLRAPAEAPPAPGARPASREPARPRPASPSVRLEIGRLDRLAALGDELARFPARLGELAAALCGSGGEPGPAGALQAEAEALGRAVQALQQELLEARLVPLAPLLEKLGRMSQRLAREAGKEIDLSIRGGEVQADRAIADELAEPLMHLLRNAVDHGIEPAAQRVASGKPSRGRVELAARAGEGRVFVDVRDDGRGLDFAAIRRVAAERGLFPPGSGEPSAAQLVDLLFQPGFTTAARATRLSGRGVGLDVVRSDLARLRGWVETASEPGSATRFTLCVPATASGGLVLEVTAAGQRLGVPAPSVVERFSRADCALRRHSGRDFLVWREGLVPFGRLDALLGLPAARPQPGGAVLLLGLAHLRLAIEPDAVAPGPLAAEASFRGRLLDVAELMARALGEAGEGAGPHRG